MSFTTVESASLSLNKDIDALTDMELAQVEMLIQGIDGVINNYCGWNMLATDYTSKRFDGSGTNTLDLRLYPVNTLTQARVRAADGTFIDATAGIEILDDGVIQFLPYATTETTTFTPGIKNWFLTFNAGYGPTNMPWELTYAANFLVNVNFGKIVNESVGLKANKNTNIDVTFDTMEIPYLVTRNLDRFRMVSVF